MGWRHSECLPRKSKKVHSRHQDDLQWHQKEKREKGYYNLPKGSHLWIAHTMQNAQPETGTMHCTSMDKTKCSLDVYVYHHTSQTSLKLCSQGICESFFLFLLFYSHLCGTQTTADRCLCGTLLELCFLLTFTVHKCFLFRCIKLGRLCVRGF